MGEEYVSKEVFEEFEKCLEVQHKRLEDEDNRQNRRLQEIEDQNKQINNLALSVQELASSVKEIAKETERLGMRVDDNIKKLDGKVEETFKKLDNRIGKIEGRDGERWRSVVGYLITAILAMMIGLACNRIGLSV